MALLCGITGLTRAEHYGFQCENFVFCDEPIML